MLDAQAFVDYSSPLRQANEADWNSPQKFPHQVTIKTLKGTVTPQYNAPRYNADRL